MDLDNYIESKSTTILNIILFFMQFDTFEYVHDGGLGFFSPFRIIVLPLCILYLCNSSKDVYPQDKGKIILTIVYFIFCFIGDVGSQISNFGSVVGNLISLLMMYYLFHNTVINRSTLYVITSWAAIQIPTFIIQFNEGSINVFNRFEGLNFDPNYLCSLVIPAIWASIYILKNESKLILRLYNYVIIALGVIMVFLSYSRGGMIAFSITLFIYLFVYNKKKLFITISILGVMLSAILVRAQFVSYKDAEDNFIDGFIYRNFTKDDVSEITSGRSDLILKYYEEIENANYVIIGSSLPQYINDVNKGSYSHNGFVDICVQSGLVVGGAFCILLLWGILCVITRSIKKRTLPYEIIFILSVFITLIFLAFSAKLIWLIIGMLLSISNQLNFEKYLIAEDDEEDYNDDY